MQQPNLLPAPPPSGVNPLKGYERYYGSKRGESMLWMTFYKLQWRTAMLQSFRSQNATCFLQAVVHVLNQKQMKAILASYQQSFPLEGLTHPINPSEAIAWFKYFKVPCSVFAVSPMNGYHAPVQLYAAPNSDAGICLLLFDNESNYRPHWVPVTAVIARRRLALTLAEKESVDELNLDPDDVFQWEDYLNDVRQGLIDPPGPHPTVENADPVAPINYMGAVERDPLDEVDLTELFAEQTNYHHTAIQDDYELQQGDFDGLYHQPDITAIEARKRADLVSKCMMQVGVHPFPIAQQTIHLVSQTPRFYYVGGGDLPEFNGIVIQGPPGPKDRAIYGRGLLSKAPIMWELHPKAIQEAYVDSSHLVYVQVDEPRTLDPTYLANGCFNPSRIGCIQTDNGAFDLIDPFEVQHRQIIYTVYRLSRRHASVAGLFLRALPFHTEKIMNVTIIPFQVRDLPSLLDFPSRKAWLRAVFTILASMAPEEVKGNILEQRNEALNALESGTLPATYDPVATARAVCHMRIRVQNLMGTPGLTLRLA
jgi:hypothetical protein